MKGGGRGAGNLKASILVASFNIGSCFSDQKERDHPSGFTGTCPGTKPPRTRTEPPTTVHALTEHGKDLGRKGEASAACKS